MLFIALQMAHTHSAAVATIWISRHSFSLVARIGSFSISLHIRATLNMLAQLGTQHFSGLQNVMCGCYTHWNLFQLENLSHATQKHPKPVQIWIIILWDFDVDVRWDCAMWEFAECVQIKNKHKKHSIFEICKCVCVCFERKAPFYSFSSFNSIYEHERFLDKAYPMMGMMEHE